MNNWDTQWFLVFRARERQQGFLYEAELDQVIHGAHAGREPTARAFNLRAWISRTFGFRPSKRALGR